MISLPHVLGASAGGSAVASWTPAGLLLSIFFAAVCLLFILGKPGDHPNGLARVLLRVPNALERLTGIPGWAAAASLTSMYGLLVAGVGFYSDVAYHIAFGRDEELFTAPHVGILIGLSLLLLSAVLAIVYASLTRVDTRLRWRSARIPWSAIPMGVIGIGAVTGFPIDDIWHRLYGVDVTLWSPPHLMMVLGAAFSGMASWLIVAESGVRPGDSAWARGFHVAAAWLTLLGLTAPAAEFYFGVPQWQLLFHPVLVMLAAGISLVAMRIVLGAGWTLGIAVFAFLGDLAGLLMIAGSPIPTRPVATYLGAALVVELVALAIGTERRLRFGLAAGAGIGTLGLGVEWAWNAGAHLPWSSALFPDALLLGLFTAVAAAIVGAAFGSAVAREQITIPLPVLVLAGVGLAIGIILPLPREVGEVVGTVSFEEAGDGLMTVHVELDPPDAAEDARWFTAGSWQGGDKRTGHMQEVGPGQYVGETPIDVTAENKSMLRLHRGAEMMAIPLRFPPDDEIGEPEILPEDRTAPFEHEEQYLQREVAAHDAAGPWFARFVFALTGLLAVGWIVSLGIGAYGLSRREEAAAPAAAPEPSRTPAGRR
jgi:hypothetical protein